MHADEMRMRKVLVQCAAYCTGAAFGFLALSALGAENGSGGKKDVNKPPSQKVDAANVQKPKAKAAQAPKKKLPAESGEWPTCGGVPYDPIILECCNGVLVRLGEAPPKNNVTTKPKP
jgi:hypothetical protein